MPIDPNIALGFRGVQAPDPLAQYGALTQIQGAQQANALRGLQMRELEEGVARRNRLAAQLGAPEFAALTPEQQVNALTRGGFLTEARSLAESQSKVGKEQREAEKSKFDLVVAQRKFGEDLKRGLSANPSDENIIAFGQDAVLQGLYTPAQVDATVKQLLALPTAERVRILSQAGATAGDLRPVAVGGSLMTPQGQVLATAPRQSQLLTPEEEAQKARIAFAGRAPAQPAAPTITQIQDPTNPAQMITIDARRYQGGGVGAVGVLGTTGKTAPVAAAEQKRAEGASQAQDILDTLRTAYDELDRMQAVPSEQRGALANAVAYVASTGAGQIAGRVAGTKEQTQRDIIASARNQMLNAIKNATGMSAQQLNSNVEFRSWLEALTDPTRSIEANRSILENMERFIASGGKYSAKKGNVQPSTPAPAPAGGATGGWSVVR